MCIWISRIVVIHEEKKKDQIKKRAMKEEGNEKEKKGQRVREVIAVFKSVTGNEE